MTPAPDMRRATWRRSSYSDGQGGSCVEVAHGLPGLVPVRDSKDPEGPALIFTTGSWAAFVSAVRRGAFPVA